MIIYLDADYKCHTTVEYGRIPFETDFFDGAAADYIEGYRFVPSGKTWTREDGVEFAGEMIAPWKPWNELDAVQREYEREQLAQYESALSEIEVALGVNS